MCHTNKTLGKNNKRASVTYVTSVEPFNLHVYGVPKGQKYFLNNDQKSSTFDENYDENHNPWLLHRNFCNYGNIVHLHHPKRKSATLCDFEDLKCDSVVEVLNFNFI